MGNLPDPGLEALDRQVHVVEYHYKRGGHGLEVFMYIISCYLYIGLERELFYYCFEPLFHYRQVALQENNESKNERAQIANYLPKSTSQFHHRRIDGPTVRLFLDKFITTIIFP